MFNGATSFNQNLSTWNVANVTTMANMFNGDTLSTINYDALLSAWSAEVLKTGVSFHAGSSKYCAAYAPNRSILTTTYTWTITDGGVTAVGCDSTPPTFTMQFYSDAGLTTTIADNAPLKAGTYYVKVTSDEALSAAPTLTINAEGTNNDVTNVTTTLISGNNYSYTYLIIADAAAVGTTLADFAVTGTDTSANTATGVDPTNEATKAIYTDTTAPATPGTPDLQAASDTGTSSTDNLTSDTTPTFTGTGTEANETIKIYDGVTLVCTTTSDGAGAYSCTTSALADGTHTITVTQTDLAGNISTASTGLSVTIDTTSSTGSFSTG